MDEIVFHEGELRAHSLAGFTLRGAPIRNAMPDQHRVFFAHLPFILLATIDKTGVPQATALAGAPGFVTSPDPRTLRISAWRDPEEPTTGLLIPGAPLGLLGIDLATRRRNRANGMIAAVDAQMLEINVNQSFGNCPQYIQGREVRPVPDSAATVQPFSGLDARARATVRAADTFFVATSSGPAGGIQGGADMSHRGGRPGFIRLEGDVLTIPDFRGNRYFNTLGNLLLDPRAALLFVDFERGDLLHLQGEVEISWDASEARGFVGAERLWRVRVTGGWRKDCALPLQWTFRDYAPTTERTGIWA